MRVKFLKDTQPRVETGNEFYPAGTVADFSAGRAQWLAESGFVELEQGQAPAATPAPPTAMEKTSPAPSRYSKYKVAELRELAIRRGIEVGGLRRTELIAALEESDA